MDKELSKPKTSKLQSNNKGASRRPLYSKVAVKPRNKKQKCSTKRRLRCKIETNQPLLSSVALSKSRKTSKQDLLASINLEAVLGDAYKIPQPSFSFYEKLRIHSPGLIRSNSLLTNKKQEEQKNNQSKRYENQEFRSPNSTSDTKTSKSSVKNISRIKQRCKISNLS